MKPKLASLAQKTSTHYTFVSLDYFAYKREYSLISKNYLFDDIFDNPKYYNGPTLNHNATKSNVVTVNEDQLVYNL